MRVEEAPQRVELEPPEPGLAVHLEDGRQRHAGLARDESVELEEGNAEAARDLGPERALARASQAEQRDHPPRARAAASVRASSSAEAVVAEGLGDVLQAGDGDVTLAGLELREEALAHAGPPRRARCMVRPSSVRRARTADPEGAQQLARDWRADESERAERRMQYSSSSTAAGALYYLLGVRRSH